MSASISPTRWPSRASAAARFAETVDFPTPPLPLEIANTLPSAGISFGVGGAGGAGDGRAAGRPIRALGRVHDIHLHRSYAADSFDRFARLARERPWILGGEHECEADPARHVHGDVFHHACSHDIAAVARVRDLAQRALDAGFDPRFTHDDWSPLPPLPRFQGRLVQH